MTDDRGRWFRVYPRMVKQHAKFRDLSGVELGAWTALRSECELRDGAAIDDQADAVLVLRRRRIPRPRAVLEGLVERRLFDVTSEGKLIVHDRDDHDRQKYPSDDRDKVSERQRKSRASRARHDTHAGGQQAEPAPALSQQPAAPAARVGLPSEDDSATAACRKFLNGGTWLSNDEYVAAWDDMDRRFTREWVQSEIDPAFAELFAAKPKVRPWDLQHRVEFRCAERVRLEDRRRERTQEERDMAETEALRAKAEAATEEEKRRAEIVRRAVGLWLKQRPNEKVPSDFDELQAWLDRNEGAAA